MVSTGPWHCWQATRPPRTCWLWLKKTKSGNWWMRAQRIGRRWETASLSFSISAEVTLSLEWQFMHTPSGGMPAWRLFSAAKWQYWQAR